MTIAAHRSARTLHDRTSDTAVACRDFLWKPKASLRVASAHRANLVHRIMGDRFWETNCPSHGSWLSILPLAYCNKVSAKTTISPLQYFLNTPITLPCTCTTAAGTMMGCMAALEGCRRILLPST